MKKQTYIEGTPEEMLAMRRNFKNAPPVVVGNDGKAFVNVATKGTIKSVGKGKLSTKAKHDTAKVQDDAKKAAKLEKQEAKAEKKVKK